MPELLGKKIEQASTNAYVSALKIAVPTHIQRVIFHIKEKNTNAIMYKLLGSVDDSVWEEVVAEADLGKNGSAKLTTVTDPWPYLDLKIVDDVGGTHGKATVYAYGGS